MKTIHEVCVVGGGNIGHALIASLKAERVTLFTTHPEKFSNEILCFNQKNDGKIVKRRKLDAVSNEPGDVISMADLLLFTVPSNVLGGIIGKLRKYISPNCILGFIPGSGGKEFLSFDLLNYKNIIFGSQRVPFSARILEYGRSVYSPSNRKELRVGCIPNHNTEEISGIIYNLLGISVIPMPNYLNVTLTPSNQVLHTSRIYSVLKNFKNGDFYDREISFYKGWDNYTSEILLKANDELQECCKKLLRLNLNGIASLRDHYEISNILGKNDCEKLTNKIITLPYLSNGFPMKQIRYKYIPDLTSRYFVEDFPSLCTVKSFCEICGIKTPTIDAILKWYCGLMNLLYFKENEFSGDDLKDLLLPQNYGIKTIEDIYNFYI
jgi:hypothetical protein